MTIWEAIGIIAVIFLFAFAWVFAGDQLDERKDLCKAVQVWVLPEYHENDNSSDYFPKVSRSLQPAYLKDCVNG